MERKQREASEKTGLHHAATEDSESDKEYDTDESIMSYERNSVSSDGDTDYEDKCPENY